MLAKLFRKEAQDNVPRITKVSLLDGEVSFTANLTAAQKAQFEGIDKALKAIKRMHSCENLDVKIKQARSDVVALTFAAHKRPHLPAHFTLTPLTDENGKGFTDIFVADDRAEVYFENVPLDIPKSKWSKNRDNTVESRDFSDTRTQEKLAEIISFHLGGFPMRCMITSGTRRPGGIETGARRPENETPTKPASLVQQHPAGDNVFIFPGPKR